MAYRIDVAGLPGKGGIKAARTIGCAVGAACLTISFAMSASADAGTNKSAVSPTGLEVRGTVIDYQTRQPLEGAYVVASYYIRRADIGGQTYWCVKTRGMYTGVDGKYWFPVEARDGVSPQYAAAIKPGYAYKIGTQIQSDVWNRQDQNSYSGHDIFLIQQDEQKPDFHFGGDQGCWHAETREAAAAGVEFQRIELGEYEKYKGSEQAISGIREEIAFFGRLPKEGDVVKSGGPK